SEPTPLQRYADESPSPEMLAQMSSTHRAAMEPPQLSAAGQSAALMPNSSSASSAATMPMLTADNSYLAPTTTSRYGAAAAESTQPGPSQLGAYAASAMPLPAAQGAGEPGSKQLEGPQSPHLVIQKTAPQEIQVGRPATFKIRVANDGTIAASNVEVHDLIPKGTQLIDTNPRASQAAAGELVWQLGTLQPGDESTIEIQLTPITEGEIGSVATLRFSADASARSIATKPELVVKTSAPTQVLVGETMTLEIEVANPGSGTATGVVLAEHVPAGLQHEAGNALEYEIGELKPGESRKLELSLTAGRPGPVTNVLAVQGDYNLSAEDRTEIEVIAPELAVAVDGPKRRYLEREAVYKLSVSNPGTAPAEQVELVAYLPSGLKFVSADNAGYYEESDQTVRWNLEELPTNETGTVGLVTMPIEAGDQQIRLRGSTEKGLTAEHAQTVAVEGIAEVYFEVVDVADPIEVGGQTTYEVRVLNKGSDAATNVRLLVTLPQMQPLSAEGPTRYQMEGNSVRFEAIPRLAAKADTTFRIRAQSLQPGDLRVQVQLQTDGMDSPVIKQESTRVYADE
ncbi:MAG TPA: DUF11 domain-containing protein, partial [Thermoguttaceae bacterium]|nr:DUF11 domain-containing protein [Thermoguttaceae bacterium]